MIELNRIYHQDCLVGMQKIDNKSIDCIICDLPYNLTSLSWDTAIPFDKLWKEYNRIIKDNGAVLLFGQEPFSSYIRLSNIKHYKYDIYWQKERIVNIFQVKRRPGKVIETISVFYKKQCTYNPQMTIHDGKRVTNKIKNGKFGVLVDNGEKIPFEYNDKGLRYPLQIVKFPRDILKSNLHPTQKPVSLLEYLIKTYTNEEDIILDNCIGSGTTAIAALRTNRRYIGFELNEKYFNVAQSRINEYNRQ